jgi:hypothetical protein
MQPQRCRVVALTSTIRAPFIAISVPPIAMPTLAGRGAGALDAVTGHSDDMSGTLQGLNRRYLSSAALCLHIFDADCRATAEAVAALFRD